MNFIEAALLIQGSACVYSKKVEYLYSLVYQALDFISGKRRAKQLSSVQEDGTGEASNSGVPHEAEDEFLSLDDFPVSRANLTLKSDQAPSELHIIPLCPWPWWPLMNWRRTTGPCTAARVRSWPAGKTSG